MGKTDFEMNSDGVLVPFESPIEEADREDFATYLRRLGFKATADGSIGDREKIEAHLEWYERSAGDGHQYLAIWFDEDNARLIFLRDWPALLRLQAMVAPIIQAALNESRLSEIQRLSQMAFRAWHGHEPSDICEECDPAEYRRRREVRRAKASAASRIEQ